MLIPDQENSFCIWLSQCHLKHSLPQISLSSQKQLPFEIFLLVPSTTNIPINQTQIFLCVLDSIFLLLQLENQESVSNQTLPTLSSHVYHGYLLGTIYVMVTGDTKINKTYQVFKELTVKYPFLIVL